MRNTSVNYFEFGLMAQYFLSRALAAPLFDVAILFV